MKYLRIIELLERRIQQGDYASEGIPPERELADDIGVSRATLRKALESLERKGVLERAPNRQLVVNPNCNSPKNGMHIALFMPTLTPKSFSPDLQLWLAAIQGVTRQRGDRLSVINYYHWDDPILFESIHSFDGVFLITNSEAMPTRMIEYLASSEGVVMVSEDYTKHEIPSIVLFPPRFTDNLMRCLQQLGHRRIDCLNVQGHNTITLERINAWGNWLRSEEVAGRLIDRPCLVDENIFEVGYEVAQKWIQQVDQLTTAVMCVTLPVAMGVLRAASEQGIKIGEQLSVCTIDVEGIGAYLYPPIASFDRLNPAKYLNRCVDWFANSGTRKSWQGPLLLEPRELKINTGESMYLRE